MYLYNTVFDCQQVTIKSSGALGQFEGSNNSSTRHSNENVSTIRYTSAVLNLTEKGSWRPIFVCSL